MKNVLIAIAVLAMGCGDDGGDGGGGIDAGNGGGDPVDIPEVTITCETDLCGAANGGQIVFFAFLVEDCATALGSPTSTTEAAGRGAPYSCAGGICTGTSDDSPSEWDDDDDVDVTQIPADTYSVIAWLDHNGNLPGGAGPDLGDTLCCLSTEVSAATTSVNLLSASCVDQLE